MKRFMLAIITILTASAAQAADLPRQAPVTKAPVYAPAPVSLYDWTGFYVGVNGGYDWGRSRYNFPGVGSTGPFGFSSGLVGGTVGANYQFGHLVAGVEGDLDWIGLSGSTACPNQALTCQTSSDWIGTARGRVGFAWDRFLPYVTGGAAFGNINATIPGLGSTTDNKVGWTAGAGLEYAMTNNWSAKIEYLHIDLGSVDCGLSCNITPPARVRLDENTVRAGVNYKFNWGQ